MRTSIYREELTPRELVMLALNHMPTPRVPFSLGFGVNLPAKLKLMEYLEHRDINETDEFLSGYDDIRRISIPYIGPSVRNSEFPDGKSIDIWGVIREPVTYTKNGIYHEICTYPMADIKSVKDLESFNWPSPDWYDYSVIPDIVRKIDPDRRYAIMLGNGNIFETTWYMRGLEQSLIDMVENPELIEAIFDRVTTFFITYFSKAMTAAGGCIDIVFTADDIAGQTGMMFSPDLWKKLIKPYHKKLNNRLREYGVKIIYHCDGAAHSVLEEFIDMGIDAWEALQLDADGMDANAIKKAAGNRLAFHGGISVQQLLPYANPSDVKKEVSGLISCLGEGGGYIAAPSHAIQAGTPPENIIAMLETVRPAKF